MRIDLTRGGTRPWPLRIVLGLMKRFLGVLPGPPTMLTYRPDLYHRQHAAYIQRGMHGSGGWDKGHAELFSAFVSKLNTCGY